MTKGRSLGVNKESMRIVTLIFRFESYTKTLRNVVKWCDSFVF